MRYALMLLWYLGVALPSAEAVTHYTFEQQRDDQTVEDPVACSNDIVARLEARFGCKFKATAKTDQLCGAVQIIHGVDGLHQIDVYLYDDADPIKTDGGYTIRKLPVVPNITDVELEIKRTGVGTRP